jgi:hypothetical protein
VGESGVFWPWIVCGWHYEMGKNELFGKKTSVHNDETSC